MMNKTKQRLRRAKKARAKINNLNVVRLTVHKTPRHIYAQLIDPKGKILSVASTLDKKIRNEVTYGGNIAAAKIVGQAIAVQAKNNGIERVAFDRSGFRYHGRIRALAEAAREGGINF